eukprot:6184637-Pleurochrysis_carterae.AAC.1
MQGQSCGPRDIHLLQMPAPQLRTAAPPPHQSDVCVPSCHEVVGWVVAWRVSAAARADARVGRALCACARAHWSTELIKTPTSIVDAAPFE